MILSVLKVTVSYVKSCFSETLCHKINCFSSIAGGKTSHCGIKDLWSHCYCFKLQIVIAANGASDTFCHYLLCSLMCLIRVIQFLLTTRFVFVSVCSRGMAKLLQKEEMGRASYKVCTLFQLLEKEGKDKICAVINITAV